MPTFIKLPSGRIIAPAHITDIYTGDDYTLVHMDSGERVELKRDSADTRALLAAISSFWVEVKA